ncbi:ABC transporter ATP-binding protein [Bacillus sp. Marseille-P3661]|uniref:ABC transporter ATP-binding protein n=1 Tax=Bacillus sp. Marseille-P3661 TaxID=1936234 RepID=UPI000C824563|nr:ATP-binding cassette domain-containing protein [Bacillus sp. Marseille-P3661]
MIDLLGIKVVKKGKQILDVAKLNIESNKVTAIIGPNGAGKSTLLKVMALLEIPSEGTIYLDKNKVNPGKISVVERRKLSVVFQQPLMLDTTVYQNVALGLKLRKQSRKIINERVEHWLAQFGVTQLSNQRARTLSGGEAQRVSLARALASEPEILFLDEPFSALDLPTRRKLLKDLKEILNLTKTTVIFISHDYHEVQYLCDDILIMFNGNLVNKSNKSDILNLQQTYPEELSVFLRDWMTPLIEG